MTNGSIYGVDILKCPISHSDLHWLSGLEIAELNERIRVGSLRHLDGTTVERPLTAALASASGEFIYRVEDGIFFLLSTTALHGGPPATVAACCDLAPETKTVRSFYDEFGWRESDGGFFEDALKFADLRPVSRDYTRNCRLRLAKYLPPRGTYLLDAACGPIQYPEYFTYSTSYDFRICADVSEVALRHAQKRLGENGIYLLCDVTSLPLKDGVVDGFVSLHTIYHVPARQQSKAIAELYRVLKEHGSGVVVYSWGRRSPLMNAVRLAAYPLQALGRIVGAVRSPGIPGHAAGRRVFPPREGPSLFSHFHDFRWYRKNVERPYRSRLASWRSVSVPFLQTFVHERALGRPLLALLFRLESRFPRWFGRYGQYPIFVFTKECRPDYISPENKLA
jgi:ubiquinone/menaquinone biosynthesis C-methylase UbiE